jgi:DNA processing protein
MKIKKEILVSYFPYITYKRYKLLIRACTSLDEAWNASAQVLIQAGWKKEIAEAFITWKSAINEQEIIQKLEEEHIFCITPEEPTYPTLLKEVYDPPLCLFVRGTLDNITCPLAVVGARKTTPYGRQITQEIVSPLARAGVTIISGLAFGIDSVAHNSALEAQGITVAVLGGGIDTQTIYPRQHISLVKKIIAHGGAVISEYPPGTEPTRFSFPKRNRIIAGMSLGTLVIEAGKKSGSLVTAHYALDTNRDVFAIPQNITSKTSIGTNEIIKQGAHIVTTHTDILEILHLQDVSQYVTNKEIFPASPTEAKILPHLSREAVHVDSIIKQSNLDSASVMSTLTLMEMKGVVKNLGSMMYILNS